MSQVHERFVPPGYFDTWKWILGRAMGWDRTTFRLETEPEGIQRRVAEEAMRVEMERHIEEERRRKEEEMERKKNNNKGGKKGKSGRGKRS